MTTGPWATPGVATPLLSQETHRAWGPARLWPGALSVTSRAWMPSQEVVLWEPVTASGKTLLHRACEDPRAFASPPAFRVTRFI